MDDKLNNDKMHRFTHEAMATTFKVIIAGETRQYARQAAAAAFAEIDRVEGALSRYIESSDIAQLNRMGAGKATRIGTRAFECLQVAARVCAETRGAFDVTVGPLMACWRNPDKSLRTPTDEEIAAARERVGMHLVELDPSTFSVRLKADDMCIDLGGIGKGFALDQVVDLFADWDVESALIHSESTVLAVGIPPGEAGWSVGVGGSGKESPPLGKIRLEDMALSGSGIEIRGRHIFDPREGRPATGKIATWSVCLSAATADALSTAFMVLSPKEVEQYCHDHPDTCAMLLLERGGRSRYVWFGDWQASLGLQLTRPESEGN